MRVGLEVVLGGAAPGLRGRRAGLVTNQSGVDARLRSGIDLLTASGLVDLRALFGPEHGVRGEAQAGEHVPAATDARTDLPVHSLYGETRAPAPEMLDGLDALLFDVQDIGVRYATYLSTMLAVQEAAAHAGLEFRVLDRPNPLGGVRVEGPVLDPAFASFVGAYPLPVLHGLTLGEIARLAAAERGWPEPEVVRMEGWRRAWRYDETGLPWVQPSPNLPTLDAVTLYPGTCLLEGTNASEGRGTTRPFELLGAPWVDPHALAAELERRALPGILVRPAHFTPMYGKHAGASCGGVQVHVADREALRPVALGLHLLDAIRWLWPEEFAWVRGADGRFFVDLLLGTDAPRRALEVGAAVGDVSSAWGERAGAFQERTRPFLLY